jgi:hypothetical protein
VKHTKTVLKEHVALRDLRVFVISARDDALDATPPEDRSVTAASGSSA